MQYAATVNHIPKEVCELIQIFFNQIYPLKADNFVALLHEEPSSGGGSAMIYFFGKLFNNLKNNQKTRNEDIKRSNAICLKLCLILLHYSQQVLNKNVMVNNCISMDVTDELDTAQVEMTKFLYEMFQGNHVVFNPENGIAMELGIFFSKYQFYRKRLDKFKKKLQYVLFPTLLSF